MKKWFIYVGAIVALNFTLYFQNLKDFFVSDDFDWLALTKYGDPLWQAFVGNYYGVHGQGGAFRPMVNIFFELGHLLGGSPVVFHVMHILIHSCVVMLVGYLGYLLVDAKYQRNVLWISAILFSFMPFHAEAVIWLSAIGDPLATLFFLLSFVSYIHWRKTARSIFVYSSLLAFGLSLITKEFGVVMPVLILTYEVLLLQNYKIISLFKKSIAYIVMTCGYLLYRQWAIGILAGYYAESSLHVDLVKYAQNLLTYLITFFVSDELRRAVTEVIVNYWMVAYCTLFIIAVGVVYLAIKKVISPIFVFLLAWIVIHLTLVTPLSISLLTDEGERYVYIASVGLAILLSYGTVMLREKKYQASIVVSMLLLMYWGNALGTKGEYWHQASLISKNIYFQLQTIPLSDYKKTFFVGIPESYEGAQVMRNGIVQALELIHGGQKQSVERIPVYTVLTKENAYQDLYKDKQIRANGIHFTTKDEKFMITGDAAKGYGEYYFELWNYLYTKPLADTIHLEFRGGREYDWARGEVSLYYYDEGRLIRVHRNKAGSKP